MKGFAELAEELPEQVRWFVMTNWNLNSRDSYLELMSKHNIRYLAYGEEIAPDTGKEHHQCFMYFTNARKHDNKALNKIGNWWGDTHCYVAPMIMGVNCNEKYCKKDGKFHELGGKPQQGARGDLDMLKDMVLMGTSVDDIACEDPIKFHQYGRTLERIEIIRMRKQYRKEMTKGIWITGKAGFGKSHALFEGYSPDTHFVKDLSVEWWDGYKQQDTVLLNEFRGCHMSYSTLLALVDKWPHMVKWRGRESVPFVSKKVIISSIVDPRTAYKGMEAEESWEQFDRRFDIYVINEKEGKPVLMENSLLAQKCSEGNIRTSEPSTPFNSPIWDF